MTVLTKFLVAVITRRNAGFHCTPSCKISLQILFFPFKNYGMRSLMTSGAPDDLNCKTLGHCLSLRDKSDVNGLQSVYVVQTKFFRLGPWSGAS